MAEHRRSAGIHPAAAQGVQKIPHVEALTDIVLGIEFPTGIQGKAAFCNHLRSQRDVRRHYQVAHRRLPGDVVVCNVKTRGHPNRANEAGSGHLHCLVGDQGQLHTHPVRGAVKDLLDHFRAGVGIDPYLFCTHYFPGGPIKTVE